MSLANRVPERELELGPARQPITIVMPGEAVPKGRPRFTREGRAYTPAKTRHYENGLKLVASEAMAGRRPLDGPVRLLLEVFLPIPASKSQKWQRAAAAGLVHPTTKPDLDNLLKGAADALNGIVWHDDKQIIEATLRKVYSDRPRLELTVTEA